jgi:dolichol-phosphate mannosyltransferase
MKKITVLLPMYNEEKSAEPMIKSLTNRLKKDKIPHEILVVNDGSTDNTNQALKKTKREVKSLRVINHKKNMGLGGALETGFRNAKTEIIVTMDADLTQNPRHISKMVKNIEDGYDMVIGSRYVKGGGMSGVPPHRVFVSRFANTVFGTLFGIKVKDMTSGFRCYRTEFLKGITIEDKGFASQLEILIKYMKKDPKIKEIPFILVSRTTGESKFDLPKVATRYFKTVRRLQKIARKR